MKINACIESRKLPDGRGGVFMDGELIDTCDTEADSDSLALMWVRVLVSTGVAEQDGQAFKDEQPIDLFDMRVK